MPRKSDSRASTPQTGGPFAGRVISGPLIISGGGAKGRRVSGAMQYALMPSPPDSPASSLRGIQATDEEDIDQSGAGLSQVDNERDQADRAGHENGEAAAEDPNSADAADTPAESQPNALDLGLHDEFHLDADAEDADDPDGRAIWRHLAEITSDPEREEDAAWMAYVRGQLAALFPDFFGVEDLEELDAHSEQDDGLDDPESHSGETYGNATADRSFAAPFNPGYLSFHDHTRAPRLAFPSILHPVRHEHADGTSRIPSDTPSTLTLPVPRLVSDSSSISSWSLPTPRDGPTPFRLDFPAADGGVGMAVGAGTAIPSVRDEISAMRQEMERLRSFVGDLSRGSRQDSDETGVGQDGGVRETHVATVASHSEREGGDGPGQMAMAETSPLHSSVNPNMDADASIPQALLENLASAASLIRTLHRALAPRVADTDAPAPAQELVCDDQHVFSEANLAALEDAVGRSDWALRA